MDYGCVLERTSGRQPQLITPENEGGDETTHTSPPKCFDDPDVLVGPRGPPEPPGPPDPSPAGDRERVEPRSSSRERFPLRPSQPELQLLPMLWMMLTMISHHRKKGIGDISGHLVGCEAKCGQHHCTLATAGSVHRARVLADVPRCSNYEPD